MLDGAGRREASAEGGRLHQRQPHPVPKQHAAHPQEGQRGDQDHVRELERGALRQRLVWRSGRQQLQLQHEPQQPVHCLHHPLPVRWSSEQPDARLSLREHRTDRQQHRARVRGPEQPGHHHRLCCPLPRRDQLTFSLWCAEKCIEHSH